MAGCPGQCRCDPRGHGYAVAAHPRCWSQRRWYVDRGACGRRRDFGLACAAAAHPGSQAAGVRPVPRSSRGDGGNRLQGKRGKGAISAGRTARTRARWGRCQRHPKLTRLRHWGSRARPCTAAWETAPSVATARKGKDLAARALGSRPTTCCPGHARKTRHRPSYETIWPPRPPAARQDWQRQRAG
jgi:hypothetical protein